MTASHNMASSDPKLDIRGDTEGRSERDGLVLSSTLASLFRAHPDAIAIIDADSGEILDANVAFAKLLRCQRHELTGQHYSRCYSPGRANKHQGVFEELIRTELVAGPFETEITTKDGRSVPVEIRAEVTEAAGGKRLVAMLLRDLTERRPAEEALRASEERYRSLVDNIGLGVALISPQMQVLAMNRQMRTWYPDVGLACRPVCYRSFNSPQRDEPCAQCPACSALQDGQVHESVVEMATQNGARVHRIIASPVRDRAGSIVAVTEMVEDITERRRTEDERAGLLDELRIARERTQRLARRVVSASEEERKRLSRELHDEASQMLTVLSIQLDLLRQELPLENAAAQQHLRDMIDLTVEMGTQIVGVVRSLRPPALDTLGLNAALEELCREFAQRSGLTIRYQGAETASLTDMASTSLYRVVQEALTNVAKHAQAQHAEVRLAADGRVLSLSVSDDGRGFDAAPSRTGLGLEGMRERIDQLGGQLEIETQPGKGTRLLAQIPCEEAS
ncbi:MAG TPA: PAS domain S-box protein [Verrucomicrobiae bacterium]|nr:PAS domain S-box protein [Verrucomicrobiae bacterium]